MVLSFASRVRHLPPSILLLSCSVFGAGCEALIGAEFDGYEPQHDAGISPVDGSSTADTSSDGDAQLGAIPDTRVPPREGGGTLCTPGEVNEIAGCSNCGRYVQICNERRSWDPPFCQPPTPPAECAPDTTERRPCETDGTQIATCTSNCIWEVGACDHSMMCVANQSEKQPCGKCGTQSRSCQATDGGGKWTPFSMCMDQKDCAPSEVERESCGKCGTHARLCNALCTWGSWEICQNEGECVPGDTQERACLIGLLRQTRTCSDRCVWGEWIGLCL